MQHILLGVTNVIWDNIISGSQKVMGFWGWPQTWIQSKNALALAEYRFILFWKKKMQICDRNSFCFFLWLPTEANFQSVPDRSSPPKVLLGKGVLKICSKFTEEHPWQSVISMKLNTSGGLLLVWPFREVMLQRFKCSFICSIVWNEEILTERWFVKKQ